MSPEECISGLDRDLAAVGEDAILRRVYGQAPNTVNVDVPIRAIINTNFTPVELAAGISQGDSKVIMSPSEIANAQWPGGELPSASVPDPTLPRRVSDRIIEDGGRGRSRTIDAVNEKKVDSVRVRIELRILG